MTVVNLTSGSSWTVPSDWNNGANSIECIGGGGGGVSTGGPRTIVGGPGGGGGGYGKKTNLAMTAGAATSYQIGSAGAGATSGQTNGTDGGDTWFKNTSTVVGYGGQYAGAAGGGLGTVTHSGGNGGGNGGGGLGGAGSGGGGAGGSSGSGGDGGTGGSQQNFGSGGAGTSPGGDGGDGGAVNVAGSAGTAPGGGGGGAGVKSGGQFAGSGAAGKIIITYTPLPAPTVTSCSPSSGPASGGTSVTITGTGFASITAVTFGGTSATGISVVNTTSIVCTAPAHAAGAVSVVVTNSSGSGTKASGFTFIAAPTVTSCSPNNGPPGGGTSVTITGTAFTGATGVTFGGTAATGVSVTNSTTIVCTAPSHAQGAVNVIVTTPSGSGTGSSAYTYNAAPIVTSCSPNNTPTTGLISVTITGSAFTGASAVTFGGTAATGITVVNATTITCTCPTHAQGAVNVVVTTSNGPGTGTNVFTYSGILPVVATCTPSFGKTSGGTPVTITGTTFTSASSVTFGGSAATSLVVVDAQTITCTTPAHAAGPVNVAVTTPAGTGTATNLYVYGNSTGFALPMLGM